MQIKLTRLSGDNTIEIPDDDFMELTIDLGDGQRFAIDVRDGAILLRSVGGKHSLVLMPQSGNAVRIRAA